MTTSEPRKPVEQEPAFPFLRPGSDDARAAGCVCPVIDNGHGRGCGVYRGKVVFVWVTSCPVHQESLREYYDC
jgi:hypothetical protein